ncbi:MAG: prephenate dehydrogenase/arogenate dehydrogenase family protein [Piscirickettsiaceae bacterium]|jgi:prephenate dehydrogenase|nr:prephenate dehydrogenase/arogenate dehydrogenase family protein [Piscirickettsiaceae bacterium]
MINRLAIIGVGLIGGSLSLALKKAGKVAEVVGFARSEETRQQALSLGLIDRAAISVEDAITGADVVLLAVPMGAMAKTLADIAPHLTDNMIITDAGSTKAQVVEAAIMSLGDKISQFVPGHPIAGTEKSGPSAAFPELYQGHRVILTPIEQTDLEALKVVQVMWTDAGAEVSEMTINHHDHVLAATSHLPHLLAFNLVGLLAQSEDVDDVLRFAAGGFRDFSRIASSDPVMWRDICLSNNVAILQLLKQYQQQMAEIEQAIEQQDGDYLMDLFQRAKQARDTRFK